MRLIAGLTLAAEAGAKGTTFHGIPKGLSFRHGKRGPSG
jgi:hypothetical protein